MQAKGTGSSHSRTDVAIRNLEFAIDEPEACGGTNAGPTPTDTALAALIGCINAIGNKCARKPGVDIGRLTIDVSADFDRRGVTLVAEHRRARHCGPAAHEKAA